MDIYRKLIKQIYKSYSQNKQLKGYLITVAKTNANTLSQTPKQKLVVFVQNIISIIKQAQRIKNDKNAKQKINDKKQLNLSFINAKHISRNQFKLENDDIKHAFQIFAWIQFYYLFYIKKIYPKKIVGSANYVAEELQKIKGKIQLKRALNCQAFLLVPQRGQKLTNLL